MIFTPIKATISLILLTGVMIMKHSIITIFDMVIIRNDVSNISDILKDELKKITK